MKFSHRIGRSVVVLGLAISAIAACRGPRTLADTTTTKPVEGRPELGMPIPLPGHATVLVPFSLETRKGPFGDLDSFSSDGSFEAARGPVGYFPGLAPGRVEHVRWHNAIVRDLESGEEWTVLDQRGVISRWVPLGPGPEPGESFVSTAVVFVATLEDTNGDGVLNDQDANVVLLAAGDGRAPHAVSPANAQVWALSHDVANARLYLQVVADTDGDGDFDIDDAPVPHVVDLQSGGASQPLVGERIRDAVEGYLR